MCILSSWTRGTKPKVHWPSLLCACALNTTFSDFFPRGIPISPPRMRIIHNVIIPTEVAACSCHSSRTASVTVLLPDRRRRVHLQRITVVASLWLHISVSFIFFFKFFSRLFFRHRRNPFTNFNCRQTKTISRRRSDKKKKTNWYIICETEDRIFFPVPLNYTCNMSIIRSELW